jgi:hypothetical protein
VVALTALVVAITYFGISRSRIGIALRASIADQETAALMGIPVRKYVTGVFIYGSVLAGLGGALMIALFPITPFTGSVVIIRGFAVSLIGGLGNVGGAVVGGLILGLVDALSAGYGFQMDRRLFAGGDDRDLDRSAAGFVRGYAWAALDHDKLGRNYRAGGVAMSDSPQTQSQMSFPGKRQAQTDRTRARGSIDRPATRARPNPGSLPLEQAVTAILLLVFLVAFPWLNQVTGFCR